MSRLPVTDAHVKAHGPTRAQLRRAAILCYLDRHSDERIAAELGICRRTLIRWKHRSDFYRVTVALARLELRQVRREFRGKVPGWYVSLERVVAEFRKI